MKRYIFIIVAMMWCCLSFAQQPEDTIADLQQVEQAAAQTVAAAEAQAVEVVDQTGEEAVPEAAGLGDEMAMNQTQAEEMAAGAAENPYKSVLTQKKFSFNIVSILRGLCGMAVIILIAWLCSSDRKRVNWGTVFKALALQFIIAVSVLMFPAVQTIFEVMGKCFVAVLDWTKAGSLFLFGDLMDPSKFGYIFVLQILPTIIFFSALTSLFFYLGILQKIVWAMGWCLTKLMRLSGAESLSCAGNIFLGQTEAPLLVKEYIPRMTKSELMLVMTAGMATMAGGVLAAYIGMLGGGDKLMEIEFAKHLLSASVMAAPGAIALSKIVVPQTEEVDNSVEVSNEKIGKNVLDAISNGTADGLKLAANVGAMLLVFYALIAGFNFIFGKIGDITSLNDVIASATDGRYTALSMEFILSYLFYPVIWLTGINAADLPLVGRLLGEKLILTEFVGYQSLATMIQAGAFVSTKSVILATYVLCGFANFASVGIQIGGIGSIAPAKRHVLSAHGFRALLTASLVALMSAAMMGMFLE